MNKESYHDLIEDKYGDIYEETNFASDYFGISQTNIILIGILNELKELNLFCYNNWEAKQ